MAEADLDAVIRQLAKAQNKSLIIAAKKRHGQYMAKAAKAKDKEAKARFKLMARSTMVNPASNPMPTCTEFKARTTGTPRPPAPTNAAITTIERLSMMHWVTPATIVGAALGSSTFHSICMRVAPNASPASMSGLGTEQIPR